jgi:hypothetical protein
VFFDIPVPSLYRISIDGRISNQPGPYTVNINREFDIESNDVPLKTGVSASRVEMFDGEGNSEVLTQVSSGVYQTSAEGMKGEVGGVYHIRVEFYDGRVYESIPDTLRNGGTLDEAYYKLANTKTVDGVQYEFDFYVNSSSEEDLSKIHLMWGSRATYKALTNPEDEPFDPMKGGNCYKNEEEHKCNYKDPCSGLKNIGNDFHPLIVRVKPCECCFCWYDEFNDNVVLNDKINSVNGVFPDMMIGRVPVTFWNMMYKMRVELSILSLSQQAYEFWKGVRDQRSAVSNIFQPVTGKIPGNIVQIAGPSDPAQGVFYATAISSASFYILQGDIPDAARPPRPKDGGQFSCLKLAPYATSKQPSFWLE